MFDEISAVSLRYLRLETMLQDIRYGLRQLGKAPALVAVAVLSRSLRIGANRAIFTLINAVVLLSVPVREPMPTYAGQIIGAVNAANRCYNSPDALDRPGRWGRYFMVRVDAIKSHLRAVVSRCRDPECRFSPN